MNNNKKYSNRTQRSLTLGGVLAASGILLTLALVGASLAQQAFATNSVVSGKITFLPCYDSCGKLVFLPSPQTNIKTPTILIPSALASSSPVLT